MVMDRISVAEFSLLFLEGVELCFIPAGLNRVDQVE